MRAHRFFTLAVVNLTALFAMLGNIRALAQTPRTITFIMQAPIFFSDVFDGNILDPSKWYTETGTPIVGSGWLTLTAAAIQSKISFSSGILRGVIQSSDWKSQDITTTDSSIGLEIWEGVEGKCHYGIVFVANGHLGLLRSKPDASNDCANQSATQSGTLYLGSNDNLGICQEGSCYQDNQGLYQFGFR